MITFKVALIPTAKGRPRFARMGGFVRTITPPETEKAEITFSSMAAQHAPPAPLQGPLQVTLIFEMPMPTSFPAWARELGPWHHDKKPDVDNLGKLVLDALQRSGAWWRDDAQVARLVMSKAYGEAPGTTVTIEQLEQPVRPARRAAEPELTAAQARLFDL